MADWRPNDRIRGQSSKASPALAEFGSRLHMVHLGNRSNDIWHSTFNGTPWTSNVRIPDQTSKAPPALAEFGGRLHMVHLGNSSNDIWHSTFDGRSWTKNVKISDQSSKAPPALAEFGGRLHMVHLGNSSNDIWHSTFDGRSWTKNVEIPNQSSKAPPALAEFGGRLHMVHLGSSSNNIWHSTFDGRSWTRNVRIPDQSSKASPALAEFDALLSMVHLGGDSNRIWHSVFDPDYVRPRYELWVSEPRVSTNEEGNQVISARGGVNATGTDPESALVTLRLRRDIFILPDKQLADTARRDTDVSLTLEYECGEEDDVGPGSEWNVFAEVIRGGDKKQSGRTRVENCAPEHTPPTGEFTFTASMTRQNIDEDKIPYLFNWDPGLPRNAKLTSLEYPKPAGFPSYVMHLWKPTADWSKCGSADTSVTLAAGDRTTGDNLEFLYGSATPAPPLPLVACISSADGSPLPLIDRIPIRIHYERS